MNVFLLKGRLQNVSPVLIAREKSKGEFVDIELLKDTQGRFFIPGSSFKGVLKHHFARNFKKEFIKEFFGSEESESLAFFEDLKISSEQVIEVRDGIKLNDYMVAEDRAKFDYEILAPGSIFELNIFLKAKDNEDEIRSIFKTIKKELLEGNVRIGAFTSKGFGLLKVEDIKLYRFKLPQDAFKYFEFMDNQKLYDDLEDGLEDVEELERLQNLCKIELQCEIKNSLIIRSYGGIEEEADSVHLRTKGRLTISGSSIKGALRFRAKRILNTLGLSDDLVKELFGVEKSKENKSKKAKLIIDECYIEDDDVLKELVHRIRIDRFTGGVIETALMDSKPIWHNKERLVFKFLIENPKDEELGLLLLIFKDLWNEDLPIGGEKSIGRGVLSGIYMRIELGNDVYEIEKKDNKLIIKGDKSKLEGFVKSLLKERAYV